MCKTVEERLALSPEHTFPPTKMPKTPPQAYTYIIYTPNLGLVIAVFVLGREHGRSSGRRREQEGTPREQ